jgi:hypothetical protein
MGIDTKEAKEYLDSILSEKQEELTKESALNLWFVTEEQISKIEELIKAQKIEEAKKDSSSDSSGGSSSDSGSSSSSSSSSGPNVKNRTKRIIKKKIDSNFVYDKIKAFAELKGQAY